ncbi:MAG: S8 family peptidase [Thermoleophilia bacterium]
MRRLIMVGPSVLLLLVVLGATGAGAASPPGSAADHPGQVRVMVVFDSSTFGSAHMQRDLATAGADVLKAIPGARMMVATLPSQAAARMLAGRMGVERVEVDSVVHATAKPGRAGKPTTTTTTAPTPAQVEPWGVTRVGAPNAWAADDRGDGVNVAVIDTGIDLDHPDLAANIEGGYMAIAATGRYRKNRSYDDDNGHGTHVAGIVAAADNDQGVVGVAPSADLYAVKALDQNGSGWTSDIVDAVYWAIGTHTDTDPANDIQVINMSLGSDYPSASFAQAVKDAYNDDILVVAAAGNDGAAVDYPGAYTDVLAVAATDISDAVPWWSSRGPEVELAAPGVNVYSTYKGGGYSYLSGTSMAAPHVSGSAALVWGTYPGWSAADVRAALKDNADSLGMTVPNDIVGNGLVRPDWVLGLGL